MVSIGAVTFDSKIKNVSKTLQQLDDLTNKFKGVGASSRQAAASVTVTQESMDNLSEETGVATGEMDRMDTRSTVLTSTLVFLRGGISTVTNRLTLLTGATGALAAAQGVASVASGALATGLGYVTAGATAAWTAISGPVGLVAGLFALVGGVGLAISELRGISDMTSIAERDFGMMGNAALDFAYILTGPFVGLAETGFNLLTGNFAEAKKSFIGTGMELQAATRRLGIALWTGFDALAIGISQSWRTLKEMLPNVIKQGLNKGLGLLNGFVRKFNSTVSKIPGVESKLSTFGTFDTKSNMNILSHNQREAQGRIGPMMARRESMMSGLAPGSFRNPTPTSTSSAPVQADPTTVKQETTVNIDAGDIDLDPRDLSHTDVRRLVDLIEREQGSRATGNVGGY